jgi:hypothetical protein
MKILEILKSRRIWVMIISAVVFILTLFGIQTEVDADTLSGLLVNAIEPISQVVIGVLAIWSYLKPKTKV